ncbi:MAG: hypothetical protein IPP47_31770 [Bryobacterales bacterium]|nr:hypothetical protein [Bryobacterales bacterium]
MTITEEQIASVQPRGHLLETRIPGTAKDGGPSAPQSAQSSGASSPASPGAPSGTGYLRSPSAWSHVLS